MENATYCSGDDLDCYSAAQAEILSLATMTKGCVLILTGDYHWSEIKVMKKDNDVYGIGNYINNPSKIGGSGRLSNEGLIQVMSSGLTESTSPPRSCEDFFKLGYTVDSFGLREEWEEGYECSVIVGGSFATIHVTTKGGKLKKVEIKLRDKNNDVKYTKKVDISSCAA